MRHIKSTFSLMYTLLMVASVYIYYIVIMKNATTQDNKPMFRNNEGVKLENRAPVLDAAAIAIEEAQGIYSVDNRKLGSAISARQE